MKLRIQTTLAAVAVAGCTVALPLQSQAANPYAKADESWITLNGTVAAAEADSFTLDYGEGIVTVEMDDWDWYAEGHKILEGDEVRVAGRVDDDFGEITTVEAASVYVKSLNTYFYASAADEEDDIYPTVTWLDHDMVVSGIVTEIDGREFTVNTGLRSVTVDTITMAYNPLDDLGYQRIDVGDRVSVSGDVDIGFFEGRELAAESVITLEEDAGSDG